MTKEHYLQMKKEFKIRFTIIIVLGIIASVFYTRLKIGMPLQSDATIQYIFKERKKIVTYKDLEIDSPYNSYKNKGLPPTPIASPGIKSIEATLYPEKTEYLYFVAKIDGGNNYSTNYEDHLKYVKEYKDERDRLNKEKAKLEGEIKRVNGKLSNQGFLAKAPESLVNEEKAKKAKFEEMMNSVLERIANIEAKIK